MSQSPSFNWKAPAGRALESALNRALALDPDTRAELAALDGRSVALRLESPPLALRIDHVLVSRSLCVERAEVGPPIGSDHRPVVATLRSRS